MTQFPLLIGLCLIVFAAATLTAALLHRRAARRDLASRVSRLGLGSARTADMRPTGDERDTPPWHEAAAGRLRPFFAAGLVRTWGMNTGLAVLLALPCAGLAGVWLLLARGLQVAPLFAAAGSLAAAWLLPRLWLRTEQGRADQAFLEILPDTTDMAVRMLRAGIPIAAAIRAIGEEAAPPVNRIFARIADQMAIGMPFEDAIAVASERVDLPDFRFLAAAILLQRATGGNLATTLESLADIMRRRRALRLKAHAATGEVRMSAYVLGSMPFFVIGGLLIGNPDYLVPLVNDPRGNLIVGLAILSLLLGFLTMRQMMRSVTQG